jgi:hypothetical protein
MNVLCLIRRHKWRAESDGEDQYEKCVRCGHYRNDVSWQDVTFGGAGQPPGHVYPSSGAGYTDGGGTGGGDAGM